MKNPIKKIFFIFLTFFMIVTMQNCAQGSFTSSKQMTSLTSGDGLSVLSSTSSGDSSVIVNVRANSHLLAGARSILWDHIYGDDLSYCEQTTTTDKTVTTFLCPGEGWLTIYLYIEYSDGRQTTKQMKIYLKEGGVEKPPEEELTGSQLYTLYCSGCHGALNTSSKRGISLSALNTAISTRSEMSSLQTQLTETNKEAIVDALR